MATTSISIRPETRNKLAEMFPKTYTWDNVIQELIKKYEAGCK